MAFQADLVDAPDLDPEIFGEDLPSKLASNNKFLPITQDHTITSISVSHFFTLGFRKHGEMQDT